MKLSVFVIAAMAALGLSQGAAADQPSLSAGRRVAATRCGTCHAVDRSGQSPNRLAPRFHDLGARYPLNDLGEALAEGMIVGHPQLMPTVVLQPAEIDNLIAYMKSLQSPAATTRRGMLRRLD